MADHLGPRLLEFLQRWLPPPPARVLDVGCGQGVLTRRLRELGYGAVGVDPEAPAEPGFERLPLEQLRCDRRFEAAVAMRSFHHIGDLDRAVAALADCLPAEGRLVVFEFDVGGVDERSERWLRERDLPPPIAPDHRDEILSFAEVDAALTAAFTRISRDPAPYLAREANRPDLEPDEEEAIAAGALAAAGMRAVYELRPSA